MVEVADDVLVGVINVVVGAVVVGAIVVVA